MGGGVTPPFGQKVPQAFYLTLGKMICFHLDSDSAFHTLKHRGRTHDTLYIQNCNSTIQ